MVCHPSAISDSSSKRSGNAGPEPRRRTKDAACARLPRDECPLREWERERSYSLLTAAGVKIVLTPPYASPPTSAPPSRQRADPQRLDHRPEDAQRDVISAFIAPTRVALALAAQRAAAQRSAAPDPAKPRMAPAPQPEEKISIVLSGFPANATSAQVVDALAREGFATGSFELVYHPVPAERARHYGHAVCFVTFAQRVVAEACVVQLHGRMWKQRRGSLWN